jgi:ATP-binding cassette subfamily B protein IrtB
MKTKIRQWLGLTERGAKGVISGSIASFFMYLAYIAPMIIVFSFVQDLLAQKTPRLWFYLLSIVGIAALMYAWIYIQYNTTYNETYQEAKNLRIEIANILKALPMSYFSKHDLTDLSQAVMRDVADIEHALSHAVPQAYGFTLYYVLMSAMLLVGNWKLGLSVMIPVLVSFLMMLLSYHAQRYGSKKYYLKQRAVADALQETIELQQEIRSYGLSHRTETELLASVEESEKIHIRAEIYQAIPTSLAGGVLPFSLGLAILVGTVLLSRGEIPLLFFFGYIITAAKLIDGVQGILMSIAEILFLGARIERIKELRDTRIQTGDIRQWEDGDIVFDRVSFTYGTDKRVLDEVSFIAKQKEVTALVGPSGCGKTTLLRVLSRLYDYDTGRITIGGTDLQSMDTDALFARMSIVFQDVVLFNASVMDNIRIGNQQATDEEVIQAAQMANCHEFIQELPEGYQTMIGENGSKLSGGERQRISIARAFLKNAPIVILDEISASLDVENEMEIQKSLNELIKDRTILIISHRMKSIENADRIVVMENGKVDAVGTHDDLAKRSFVYQRMIQNAGHAEAYRY